MDAVVEGGGINALLSAMQRFPENSDIQLQGTRGLIYMADTEENLAAMASGGIIEVLNKNLT